jgi:hypothetical protein
MYENEMADITAIMNSLLTESLEAEGYVNGMPAATLHAQLHTMQKQGSTGYDVWLEIGSGMSISEVRTKYRDARDKIEDIAVTLGISLRLKAEDIRVPKPSRQYTIKRGRTDRKISGVLPCFISSEDDTEDETRSPRSIRRNSSRGEDSFSTPKRPKMRQLLTPPPSRSGEQKRHWSEFSKGKVTPVWQCKDELGNKVRRFPRLVYRWYSHCSQGLNTPTSIRAGKFLDPSQVVPPPEWDLEAVTNHLTPGLLPSPYISFRENLVPCLFAAIKADVDAWITVVDLQKVKNAPEKWGDDAIGVCAALVNKYNLKLGGRYNYRGTGEWLVYGR